MTPPWAGVRDGDRGVRLVDVESAEGQHGCGEGAQSGDDQDCVVGWPDAVADLAVADRPVEQ